jgi:hypothetical protein
VPKAVRRGVTQKKVDHARRFIARSAASMKALLLDSRENLARLEDFPMVDRPSVCRRCNFRRLCFPRAGEAPGLERGGLRRRERGAPRGSVAGA